MTLAIDRTQSYAALVQESHHDFRVHTSAYTDPEVFEAEIRNIFERSWVYVGHESELPAPGDYVTTRIGQQPIILTRDKDGELHALLNVCRHRGNAICREQRGNSLNFRCPYHAWTYTNAGKIIAVADQVRYPEEFDKSDLDLRRVPRFDSYQGLLFASLSDTAPSLEQHLGGVRSLLDLWAKRSIDGSIRLLRPQRYAYSANWKFQAENGVDGYHPGIVHESANATYEAFGRWRPLGGARIRRGKITRGFSGGHSTLEGGLEDARGIARSLPDQLDRYQSALIEQHGRETADEVITNRHIFIFPNVFVMDDVVRVIYPVAPDYTEVASHTIWLAGVPESFNAQRIYDANVAHCFGLANPSDLEIFHGNQTGLLARHMEWLVLSRGMGKEERGANGENVGIYADETPQRAFYRQWAMLMTGTVA